MTDDFNRADSAVSLGGVWTARAGTWGISSNKAYLATAGGGDDLATVDSAADGDVQVTLTVLSALKACLLFRWSDASNYWYAGPDGSGTLFEVWKVVAATPSLLFSYEPAIWPGDGTVLKINLAADAIALFLNGSSVASGTDAFNQTATKHGLRTVGASADRWDDFSAPDPVSGAPTGFWFAA